ncbi:MAG: hypothetical protein AAGA73_21800 [Pseudomonadota bacterium]
MFGLLAATAHHATGEIAKPEKSEARDLILSGGPSDASERSIIFDYFQTDVVALRGLLLVMAGGINPDLALILGG